jgi:hypothetical protein
MASWYVRFVGKGVGSCITNGLCGKIWAIRPSVMAQDIVPADEAHLDIHLGEFWLPVAPRVLVPVASGDLVVLVQTPHHGELLVELWETGVRA